MSNLLKFYRTAAYLKPKQIRSQIKWRLFRNAKSKIPLSELHANWQYSADVLEPVPVHDAKKILEGRFSFINKQLRLGFPPKWNVDEIKLWQYNLHYLDFIHFLTYEDAKKVSIDWIDKNPLDNKNCAWEPYPLSLRLMNFVLVFYGKYINELQRDNEFNEKLSRSIAQQTCSLINQREFHLLGNHLFENGVALTFIGHCFDGEIAQASKKAGLEILYEQLPEQFPSDGLHFELSPAYQCRMMWLLLSVWQQIKSHSLGELIKPYIERGLHALQALCHPDGDISLLNDSALSIHQEPNKIFDYAQKLGFKQESKHGNIALLNSHYYGYKDEKNYLIYDAGKVGPDYIPGHAHGDIFNFELSLHGERIIVDSGVYDYIKSDMRDYCRSTAAHNTVTINGLDQCEFWGAFRMARRVYPEIESYEATNEGFSLKAKVSNYKLKAWHHRQLNWLNTGILEIEDHISGNFKSADSYLHLHPNCRIVSKGKGEWIFQKGDLEISLKFSGAEARIDESYYCPEFYERIKNKVVRWTLTKGQKLRYTIQVI